MTRYKYGLKFDTSSNKLNIAMGLYPVFDSIFQQARQIILSPETQNRLPLSAINDLTFTLECHNAGSGKELTLEVLNKHDLSFHLFSDLYYVQKGKQIYVKDNDISYKLNEYFSGKAYASNKIYVSPNFYTNIIQTMNYVKNATHSDNPGNSRLTHIGNVIDEYQVRMYNWLKLIKQTEYEKLHPSVITYKQIKQNNDKLIYQAFLQAVQDAWENYAFKANLADKQISVPDFDHVKYFKKYQADSNNLALIEYLPDSIKEWRKIIIYAEKLHACMQYTTEKETSSY